jgi:arylsulfatase A
MSKINRRDFLKQYLAGSATAVFTPHLMEQALAASGRKPNFVFILIDDLGWTDIGANGSQYYLTPNIDRLAAEGMRFTDGYAACPLCSPTRASIMTGKYPARLHLTDWIPGEGDRPGNKLKVPEWTKYLPLEEVTIAEALRAAGYATASVGKWHLGSEPYFPEHQGFDVNRAGGSIGHPASYFWPYGTPEHTHRVPHLGEGGREGEYLTDRLTQEALAFIRNNRARPFFLYFAHYAVHLPLEAKKALIDKYSARTPQGDQKNPVYAAMIDSVDQSVGSILHELDQMGIGEQTMVIFTSDNGGLWPQSTSNRPLRAGKGYPYEGGIREPFIIKWPGVTKTGSVCREPVISIDFYPTMLQIAGFKGDPNHNRRLDGRSLVPLLRQSGSLKREALFWHYPHYWGGERSKPFGAVRAGNWKLIEYYEDMRIELYNLAEDVGEENDLASGMKRKADELRRRLSEWRASVGAQMPQR